MLEPVLDLFMLVITALVFHELGHYLYVKRTLNLKTHIHLGQDQNNKIELYTAVDNSAYDSLSQDERNSLHLAGILLGAVPLLLYLFTVNDAQEVIVWMGVTIMYILSCRSDMLSIKNLKVDAV